MSYRNAVTDPPPVAGEYLVAIDVGNEEIEAYYYAIIPFTPGLGWNVREGWTAKEIKKFRIDNVVWWQPVEQFTKEVPNEADVG